MITSIRCLDATIGYERATASLKKITFTASSHGFSIELLVPHFSSRIYVAKCQGTLKHMRLAGR